MRTFVYVDGFNLYYAIKSSGYKWLNLKALAEAVLPSANVSKVRYFSARVSGASNRDTPRRQQMYLNALRSVPEIEIHLGNFLAKANWKPLLLLPMANRPAVDAVGTEFMLASGLAEVGLDPRLENSHRELLPIGRYGKNGGSGRVSPSAGAIKARVFTMEEKGSDVNLAVHLLNDAWAQRFDVAAVISNDTDLVEPIRMVAEELGKPVYLLTPPTKFGVASALSRVATHQRHIHSAHLQVAQFPDVFSLPDGKVIQKPDSWGYEAASGVI